MKILLLLAILVIGSAAIAQNSYSEEHENAIRLATVWKNSGRLPSVIAIPEGPRATVEVLDSTLQPITVSWFDDHNQLICTDLSLGSKLLYRLKNGLEDLITLWYNNRFDDTRDFIDFKQTITIFPPP